MVPGDDPVLGERSRTTAELHAEMQDKIRELQEQLAELDSSRARMGHNNPPEALEDEPLSKDDRQELSDALALLSIQPVNPADQGSAATTAAETLRSKRSKLAGWLDKAKDVAIALAVEESLRYFWTELGPKIWQKLTAILSDLDTWLVIIKFTM